MPVNDLKPLILNPDLDAWDRQPRETPLRYGQFCEYRDLGRTRTLRKVSETLALNDRYVRSLSSAYRWVDRAEAFDRNRDQLDERAWVERRRRAAENDARLLDAVTGKIAQRLGSLDALELEVPDLIRLIDVALRRRRELFGDPQRVTVALTGPGGDPLTVRLAEFASMGVEQRRLATAELVATVQRRSVAAAGVDDDDDG